MFEQYGTGKQKVGHFDKLPIMLFLSLDGWLFRV